MRLIDASALCEALMTRWSIADKNAEKTIQEVMTYVVTPIVVSQPTIDAVSVVRCKECKYFIDNLTEDATDEMYDACRWDWKRRIPNPDDFCSYGEVRDE